MKNISSKRAKACAISRKVKQRVAERDSIDGWPCCILCGSPNGLPEAHYISRANGGLGIEENIVTLCRRCHDRYDNSRSKDEHEAIKELIREHLKSKYPDWDESKLRYQKYAGIESEEDHRRIDSF